MRAKYNQSLWVGILILNLLSSVALAATPATPATPAASLTPIDPEKLVEQAKRYFDQEDIDKGIKLYAQAAELNYTPAQVHMGILADESQFFEEAFGWFLMAASQGDAAGQFNLGRMYTAGTGIEKDPVKALYWFKRSAAKNHLPAVKAMADGYRTGWNGLVKVDLDQAAALDAKAARLEAIENKRIADMLTKMAESRKKLAEEEQAKKNKK